MVFLSCPSVPRLGARLPAALAMVAALSTLSIAPGARADGDWSGQVRASGLQRRAAPASPLAQASALAPDTVAPVASSGLLEAELKGRWKALSAAVVWGEERPRGGAWRSDAAVNELYASGEAAGWQFSAGRKIVAWDVGYGFRPNDLVQVEPRRTLLTSTPQGRAVVQAEHFNADTAWSLVWANPQRAGDVAPAYGADEQALAARVYQRTGAADWHGFARWGERTRASAGAAVSWVASDSVELHASARGIARADGWQAGPQPPGLASTDPFQRVLRSHTAQALLGVTWTGENKLSLMAEAWVDGTAWSPAQWRDWQSHNRQLMQAWVPGGPDALRRGVAGNLGWQAQAFSGQSLHRRNVFLRAAWDHEGWQPTLDLLYMPADRGRIVTAALGWQGDRLRLDGGARWSGGPDDAVASQLPVRRTVFMAATWSF